MSGQLCVGVCWPVLVVGLLSLATFVNGGCLHMDAVYLNNTVWQPDSCTVCTCQDPVAVCEGIKCMDPKCDSRRGEQLQFPAGACCPVCVGRMAPCQMNGQSVPHNTDWSQSQCETCYCSDGDVTCTNKTCPPTRCRPGEVSQKLPGQCCPKCIPAGRSCVGSTGTHYPDGSEWSPLACTKCACKDGQTTCYPRQCPPLVCPQGQTLAKSADGCCQQCKSEQCEDRGTSYKHGEQWSRDTCTYCTCVSGSVECRTQQCDTSMICHRNQRKIIRPGQCCHECVPKKGKCLTEVEHYHGDIWNISDCEYCSCNEGKVQCRTAACERLQCKENEVLQQSPGKCCPDCVTHRQCQFEGDVYLDGDSWHPGPCTVCNCEEGETVCYQQNCPACPPGNYMSVPPGQCCGTCEQVECASDCSHCLPDDPQHCTRCKEFGKLAQDGRCVEQCKTGFYPTRENTCQACHASCESCIARTEFHCATCPPGLLWRDGQCVDQCTSGYYLHNGQCLGCHQTCDTCVGSGRSQCVSCSYTGHVLLRGRCVDNCGSRYYLKDKECIACPPYCRTCLPDSPNCATCHSGYTLQNGQCFDSCSRGYYQHQGTCTECHPGCLTCEGSGESRCLTCPQGYQLQGGACVSPCPTQQYMDTAGSCQACESGCSLCYPARENAGSVCTSCEDSRLKPAGMGCVPQCPAGTYLIRDLCKTCNEHCERCEGPSTCSACRAPYVLYESQCVAHCGQNSFTNYKNVCKACKRHCLQCSSEDQCVVCDSRTYLRLGSCVGQCGQGYITDMELRRCIANKYPPILDIMGPLKTSDSGITTIPSDLVFLEDRDTTDGLLSILVMRPPSGGVLVRATQGRDQLLGMEDPFSLDDLRTGKIRYVSGQDGRTRDKVVLKATDGTLFSDQVNLELQSFPTSSLSEKLNKALLVVGGGKTVLNREVLDYETSGDMNTITIRVVQGPLQGRLVDRRTEASVTQFSLRDLRTGAIAYEHSSDSTAVSDMMVLQVSDDFSILNTIININVRAENSRLPVLINNRGTQVVSREMVQLSKEMLQAQAMDIDNVRTGDLIYTLMPSVNNPKHGELVMVVPIPASGAGRGWQDVGDGMMAAKMYRFMQRDIDESRIWYRHLKGGTTSDVFTFEVADTAAPPNILKEQSFHVTVIAQAVVEELSGPTLAPGVQLGMTVLENQIVPVRSDSLLYEDADTSPTDVIYAITTLLGEGEGMLEHIDTPFKPVLRFSQDDVNNNRIIYRPPDTDVGLTVKKVTFSFVVTDGGRERRLPEQKFTITIKPVNNAAPRFRVPNAEVTVAQGGLVPVGSTLEISDADTKVENLVVAITQAPTHGRLERDINGRKVTLRAGDGFSYGDVQGSLIQYVHDGAEFPLTDKFLVSVSDGKHKAISTIKMEVLKVDKAAPYMLTSASCHVNVSEGGTVTITRDDLAFGDSDEFDEGIYIILSSETAQGRLLLNNIPLRVGGGFSQDDINNGRLTYKSVEEIGSRSLTELVYFNITDSSRNLLPSQVLSVLITPTDNQSPLVSVGPDLKVQEGGRVLLTVDSIKVLDVDSPLASLMVTIESPPSFGDILNTKPVEGSESHPGHVVKSFTVQDLVDGHVYYSQKDHKNKEPVWDNFLFYVSDGVNVSPQQRFNISITLVNDEQPHIITEQLFVQEGKAVTLTNASMYVIDIDTAPEDLFFTLQIPPSHGALRVKELPNEQPFNAMALPDGAIFSYEDILNELIVYTHDDTEAMTDMFTLHLSDGDFNDTKSLNVIIGLINDETPRMTINRGLRIQSGSTTPLRPHILKATDVDSDDAAIIYTLRRDPSAGHLLYKKGGTQYRLSSGGRARSFTQADIDNGYILYSHELGDPTGNIIFKFKLSDPEGNELIDQDFYITVLEDRQPPVEQVNKELTVQEGRRKKISTAFLSYTDADSEPGSLKYTIFEGPSLGHLELTGERGVPVTEFSQADLAARSVVYVHTSPLEVYMDKFAFSVTDGANTMVKTFYITISPVDDALPMVTNRGLSAQEGVRKLITEFDLKATDDDTKESEVIFKIVQPPVHGTVDMATREEIFESTDKFSMEDIYENRISYKHDGSETLEDNFSFVVSDGTNDKFVMLGDQAEITEPVTTPQDFEINVLALDDGSPILETNVGLQFLEFSGSEVSNLITSRELKSTDEDSLVENIVYVIKKSPKHGRLEYTANPGGALGSFTQDDLDTGRVRYVLTDQTTGYQDSFTFDLMDAKPNVVPGNVFHIMWSVISFQHPLMNVSETEGLIQVPVTRAGNLKQYSIVTCKTIPGSSTSLMIGAKPGEKDFIEHSGQVQFDEWQDSKTCTIIINDDSIFEGPETFYIELVSPSYALLGNIAKMAVTLVDAEDEPTIQFEKGLYHVNESDVYVMAKLTRTGDLSTTVSVICYTTALTATGSSLTGLESGSDYISRGRSNSYRVVFPSGVSEATCDVKIIDDSESETSEQFELGLMDPSIPASLGSLTKANVLIEGPNDQSTVFLSEPSYSFAENAGNVEVEVVRGGTDLSHSTTVWCATRLSSPASATPGQDYVPTSSQMTFGPGQISQKCQLTVLDDDFDPRLEGNETFVVFLSSALGSSLAEPYISTVIVSDTKLDIPRMTFVQDRYYVDEKNKTVNVTIMRYGDLTDTSSVICYTRQKTAEVMMDYHERVLTNASRITFQPGERLKNCTVGIVNDDEFEPEEDFLLRLSGAWGSGESEAELGDMKETIITITNHDDVPTIQFAQAAYSTHEPSATEQITSVEVKVVRSGDLNKSSSVRCSTRDGSAQSGMDYNPKSMVLDFKPGVSELDFVVDVLYNSDIEWHESFTLMLGPEDPEGAVFGPVKTTTITILDNEVSGSIILPAPPVVVSLLNYDDAELGTKIDPSPGYPLVCITPCDEHYPTFTKTHMLCEEAGINQSSLLYTWEVSLPEEEDGSRPPFMQVSDTTLFTDVNKIVLDSVYFRSRFQVRCIAQPRHENGNPGVPLKSRVVTIGSDNGICKSPVFGSNPYSYQAQSFLANLEYVGPDDFDHPNTIHISVKIPHQDGMLPLISTFPLHNLRFLLAEPIYRQQHVCSNIITAEEREPLIDEGFFDGKLGDSLPYGPGHEFPYQFDDDLREEKTLSLYKHLNLKSCIWTFDAWYHMTELVDICGGRIVSDFQVKDTGQSHLTVRVPLYVSYLYATAPVGWGSLEHRTEMEFSFYYDTILWKSGLETEGTLGGKLQILRILIGSDGKLVIDFRTTAKFRGQYVLSHSTLPALESRIKPPSSLAIGFDLKLLWSQQTFDSPHQLWRATSSFNLKDYTGRYTIELIPCSVKATQRYIKIDPIPCIASQPQSFEVPISFQQTNRPVPVVYSLNTDFQLTNNLKMFLLSPNSTEASQDDWDFNGAFSPGQKIYARVLWSPEQDLKTAYKLGIEKVYLCTGSDGYIPTYDPTGEEYNEGPQFGCMQPSPKLRQRFLILDRGNPDAVQTNFHDVAFEAQLAYENPDYIGLTNMPGVDGFAMSVDPLYKVDSGHQWYLQVIYVIGPSDKLRKRFRRSSMLRFRRDASGASNSFDEPKNGTNMRLLHLDNAHVYSEPDSPFPLVPHVAAPAAVGGLLFIIVIIVIMIVVIRRRRRRKKEPPVKPNNLVTLVDTPDSGITTNRWKGSRRSLRMTDSRRNLNTQEEKSNLVKAKEVNLKVIHGNNVDSGTEV
ncbi:extracellular matrix organizing protein FRAS1-like isoform X2 [Haliotis rufescens]|uniref:extracellular matrix organizing protein FRAS1-like isoform X1 n=1 Tax=Haliotis rufescens TaxID=6454 RepID=UPI00201EE1A3|nr:extracellular matrix organizing protein FRAS1-like isoform X1 [Haliotis rufescens]XP_048248291.1 extracellular matrix organizing protein FRAS1-like isoform X2 [Haliotis rufescens]